MAPHRKYPQRCRECGCMQDCACVDTNHVTCGWAEPGLCTFCANDVPAYKPSMTLFDGKWLPDGTLSIVARRRRVITSNDGPILGPEIAISVVRRPELLQEFFRPTIFDQVAVSVLAHVFDDRLACELARLFAYRFADELKTDWRLNEFEIRQWAAENTIPY